MSDMPQEIALFQKVKNESARKRLNIKAAFFWCTSKKESLALSRMALAMDEAGFDDEDFARPIRVNLPVVDDMPLEGIFDTTFCDRYQLGDDGMTFALIPGAAPLAPAGEKIVEGTDTTVVDGVDTLTGEIVDHEALDAAANGGETPDPDLRVDEDDNDKTEYPVAEMAFSRRLLSQYIGDKTAHHIKHKQRAQVIALALDTDDHHAQNLLLAARNSPELENLSTADLCKFTNAYKTVFNKEKRHELARVIQFTKLWVSTEHIDRGVLVKEWAAGNLVAASSTAEQSPPEPEVYKRSVPQSAANLSIEIAVAQLYPDAEPGNVSRAQLTGAKALQDRKEPIHTKAVKTLEKITDIFEYSAPTIFAATRAIKWNGEEAVVDLRAQARDWLAEHGIYENGQPSNGYSDWKDDSHAVNSSAAPSSEEIDKQLAAERGEFVPGISDPNDPKWVKTETGQQKAEPELVKKVAEGVFDVTALLQGSSTHGTKQEVETTSDVQIQEVNSHEESAGDALPQSENALQSDEGGDDNGMETAVALSQANHSEPIADHFEDFSHQDEPEQQQSEPDPQPVWPSHFEPGRYEGVPNEVYHSANGISSTMLKDARISLMYYNARHVEKTIPREETKAFLFGGHSHAFILEPGKIDAEYAVPTPPPEDLIRTTADMTAIIKGHNDTLPALMTPEEMKAWIDEYNATLTPPLSLSAGAEETANLYVSLPEEFQRIPDGTKHTAIAQRACIKEYNASLQPMLKVSGTRDQMLDQIASVSPELAEEERSKPQPLNVSGSRAQLIDAVRQIRPDAVFTEDFEEEQERIRAGRTYISLDMYQHVKAVEKAVFSHPSASRLLNHPMRQSEVSYFGFDEETGLELRVRPDLEIQLPHSRIGSDLKTVSLGNVKQERLRDRLHREIIERDYHLSAAMYCDVAGLDEFSWIFVNKDPGYHWVAVVEASSELLELGRLEYRRTLRLINEAMETNNWPAPITEDYTDQLNDFDLRRFEALSAM